MMGDGKPDRLMPCPYEGLIFDWFVLCFLNF